MGIMTKVLSFAEKFVTLPHTRLPGVFMEPGPDGISKPKDFVGVEYRREPSDGFTDDRVRNNGCVSYAPKKILPDLKGGGITVSENYPQSMAKALSPETIEANVPRQTRGIKADTLTRIHDDQREFDVSVAAFTDTLDDTPPPGEEAAWSGKANPTTKQPENPFNAKYPYNHVRETESGHLFEADDSPGAERIKESHRSGTYYEIFPDGSRVEKIVRDNFTLIVGNDRVNVQGSVIITVEGDCNMYTKGNFTHQVNGDYNLLVKGTHTTQVGDDVTLDAHHNYYHYVGYPIDASKGVEGRGNKGGESKVDVAGDYQLHVSGVASEIYGDKELYDKDKTMTKHQTLLFGDESNQIIGGMKFDQVETNRTEVIGGNRSLKVIGSSNTSIEGSDKHHVIKDKKQFIYGDSKHIVTGQYVSRSTLETEIKGSSVELNPPSPIDE